MPTCGGGSGGGGGSSVPTPTPAPAGGAGSCNNGQIPNGYWACFSKTQVIQCVNGSYVNHTACTSCAGISADKNSICQITNTTDGVCTYQGDPDCSSNPTPTPRPADVYIDQIRGPSPTPTPTPRPADVYIDQIRGPSPTPIPETSSDDDMNQRGGSGIDMTPTPYQYNPDSSVDAREASLIQKARCASNDCAELYVGGATYNKEEIIEKSEKCEAANCTSETVTVENEDKILVNKSCSYAEIEIQNPDASNATLYRKMIVCRINNIRN